MYHQYIVKISTKSSMHWIKAPEKCQMIHAFTGRYIEIDSVGFCIFYRRFIAQVIQIINRQPTPHRYVTEVVVEGVVISFPDSHVLNKIDTCF